MMNELLAAKIESLNEILNNMVSATGLTAQNTMDIISKYPQYIKYLGDEIKYKFIPNSNLEKAVYNTVVKKLNLMETALNEALAKKFIDVYKDLC